MIKFIFIIVTLGGLLFTQSLQMFIYNIIFLIRLIIGRVFIFKDLGLWVRVSLGFGVNYYSVYLIILRL